MVAEGHTTSYHSFIQQISPAATLYHSQVSEFYYKLIIQIPQNEVRCNISAVTSSSVSHNQVLRNYILSHIIFYPRITNGWIIIIIFIYFQVGKTTFPYIAWWFHGQIQILLLLFCIYVAFHKLLNFSVCVSPSPDYCIWVIIRIKWCIHNACH